MYYYNLGNKDETLMYIYLPIAEQPIHSLAILGVGAFLGLIMGLVGVGGGFLLTPIMMFLGIPPPVAVASVANQLVAPSVSGVLSHWKRSNVDFKMGTVLLLGGVAGSSIGVLLFNFLGKIGQLDFVIKLSYVIFLTLIGSLMFTESLRLILEKGKSQEENFINIIGYMDYLLKLDSGNQNYIFQFYYLF
jgi:uncharacterized membrane protein YfcA